MYSGWKGDLVRMRTYELKANMNFIGSQQRVRQDPSYRREEVLFIAQLISDRQKRSVQCSY